MSLSPNEAHVDLKIIKQLEALGWVQGDTLLYQHQTPLPPNLAAEFNRKAIKPDIKLIDPITGDVLAIIENKIEDERKAFAQLRLYNMVFKARFLYACSDQQIRFYDTTWRGLEAGEFKVVNEFLRYEDMVAKREQDRKINLTKEISIDKLIAGGYDAEIGKERYYQADCINVVLKNYREGSQKMLVHMATGLGKTRTTVALCKALLSHSLARKILFVVDRRMLAKQALDDGFALISTSYTSSRLTTTNYRGVKTSPIHVVVIDTLEMIYKNLPSNFYDLIIVDECHRSVSVSRKVVLDHFVCPRLGLTATPKIALAKKDSELTEEDLAIRDTYKLFGCELDEPTYKFDLARGIEEGFLAPYTVDEIKTYLTREAEDSGVPIEYVLDPETRARVELNKEMKLKIEQLERKYISEERCQRIAEEIRQKTVYGEKVILFGVSQNHCLELQKAINKVFNEDHTDSFRYCEAVISENDELNEIIKTRFKKPYQKPYIVTSVDIMSTGVDVPCVRYVSFAALTKSVGKYIQMIGRGSRLDPAKSGKFSFKILDFVGLCKRMEDNGKGTAKENKKLYGKEKPSSGGKPKGEYFIIDNPDPATMIQRVSIHGDAIQVIDNIPIEEARKIFEESLRQSQEKELLYLTEKVKQDTAYIPTEQESEWLQKYFKAPQIYLDETQLQRMYDYPQGSNWDFLLHVMNIKSIPTPKERIQKGYQDYITTYSFSDAQLKILLKIKEVFASNLTNHKDVSIQAIFSNPIYEKIVGKKADINKLFDGQLDAVLADMKNNLQLPMKRL